MPKTTAKRRMGATSSGEMEAQTMMIREDGPGGSTSGSAAGLEASLEGAILELLEERGAGKTICPSDAARKVDPEGWRALMEPTRGAARRLVASGEIVITQGGAVVDPARAKGAIRLKKSEN